MKTAGSAPRGSKEGTKRIKCIVGDLREVSLRPIEKTKGSAPEKEKGSSRKKTRNATSPLVAPIQSLVSELQEFGEEDTVVDVVLTSVTGNLRCPEIAGYCFFVLFELVLKGAERRSVVVSKGALNIVVQAMAASPSETDLQEHGCGILWALGMDEQYRPAIVTAGGCCRVVDALRRHGDKATVVESCFGAIKFISADSGGRDEFRKNEASRAVALAMMANGGSATLQANGCSVLTNLAVDLTLNKVSDVSGEEIKAILESMNRHPDVAAVQKQACFALNNFTFSDRNCETLAHSVLPPRDLLCRAADKFPQECRQDAQTILKRLETMRSIDTPKSGHRDRLAAANELMNSAVSAGRRGEYELAQSQFEEALKLKRSFCKPGAANPEVVHLLNCIGYVMGVRSDITGAIEKYKESLFLQKEMFSSDAEARNRSLGLAKTMSTIGLLYMKCCDHDNAEKYFTKALQEKKRIYGELSGNIDAAEDLENLGDLKKISGKHREAEEFYIISAACYRNSDLTGHERYLSNIISKLNAISKLGHLDCASDDNCGVCHLFDLTVEMKGAADVLMKLGHIADERKNFVFAQDCLQKAFGMKKRVYELHSLKEDRRKNSRA